ncbi:MAG: immR 3 [Clostridia bacterium]|jgi:transcriptional regulator with XRE-family HTH domain|nr:immR 3 [Clostridia bacterium]MDF2877934.1 immR 3 [Clostridia bacterium]
MTLVEKIRSLAKEKGLSLPKLESELGLGNGTISRWNKSFPNTDKLEKVADYFHVSLDYLLGRSSQLCRDMQRIETARNKMSKDDQERMMKILELSFNDYFEED